MNQCSPDGFLKLNLSDFFSFSSKDLVLNMNCNSFFPGYYNSNTRGRNLEANGSSWPDKIPIAGYNCGGVSLFPFPDQHLCVYMGAVRSTLLKHEAIFKDQIRELHRVYWRQKELMMEMKGTSFNSVLNENSYGNMPRAVQDTSKQVGLDLHIGRKRSGSVFDLELQDPVKILEERVCEVPEILDKPLGKIFGFQITSDKESSTRWPPRNSDLPSSDLAGYFDSLNTKGLLDLNEPVEIEEGADSESNDFLDQPIGSHIPSIRIVDESQEISKKIQGVLFSNYVETGIDLNSSPEDSCNGLASSSKRSQPSIKSPCPVKKSKLYSVGRSDLEAPVSPENNESARPSMESDSNQASQEKENSESSRDMESVKTKAKLEKDELYCLSVEDDEQKRTAAEIIIDISSSCSRKFLENSPQEPKKPSFNVCLDWFAAIALAVNEDSKSEAGLSSCECEEHSFPDEMDYFEAMTLRLTETKEDEDLKKTENARTEAAVSNLSRGSARKGSSRRGKRHQKNFQNEVLTSIASLSRNEVTADLQTIGGLMKATGTKWKSVSTKKKKTRNAILIRKKRSDESSDTILSSCDKIEVRTALNWGKITRRARGPRNPAANFQLNLGQV